MAKLAIDDLKSAVAGSAAAIRLTVRLQPAGGPGSKVFPSTHSGGVYAWERRHIRKDEVVPTVLLDSVQSQANRMEQALLEAYRAGKLKLPLLQVDFTSHFSDIGAITTLDAPHRIADAIFRDSLFDGKEFQKSDIGQAFVSANIRNATALLQYCPHALVFGIWNSTGPAGGLGNKFQRAVVSEIIGINAQKGVRTSSRLDPVLKSNPNIYKARDGEWTANPDHAVKDDGTPVKYEKKLAELNLGNITPDFVRYNPKEKKPLQTMYEKIEVGDVLPGGVTIDHTIQTTVISLPALRRLRFPVNGEETPESNNAARTVLAALALAAITHQREQGYDLRSRCLLIPEDDTSFELIANNGKVDTFELDGKEADELFKVAVEEARTQDLPWHEEIIPLTPKADLVELVRKSREAKSAGEG